MQTPDSELRTRTVECFRIYEADRNLLPATPQLVRAGCAGGLPFDSLTTDLYAGCLPAREICYGNCFAARAAYSAGIDFGRRVANILDRATFVSDLKALPAGQKFLRNGWNSDPSWSWQNALKLARWIRESGRMTIFVTKSFASIDPQILRGLAAVGAELRVSVSAFDSAAQIRHRLNTIQSYRDAGGCSIPLVMTTIFNRSELNLRQDQLVAHVLEHDLPAAEEQSAIRSRFPSTCDAGPHAPTSVSQFEGLLVWSNLRLRAACSDYDFAAARLRRAAKQSSVEKRSRIPSKSISRARPHA